MTLHTINKSPFSHETLRSCLRVTTPHDSILLIEDGVFAALEETEYPELIQATTPHNYVLLADVKARGLECRISDKFKIVDYAGFVELTTKHEQVLSWY